MNLKDVETFESMYARHQRSVVGAALRILGDQALAQDVAHDVFMKVWRNPEKFDARRGELGSYLRLMARSRALDLWREAQAAGRATDRLKLVVAHEAPAKQERPSDVAVTHAEQEAVRRAIRSLPASQREAVTLTYWGGLTAPELADRAGVPLGTAKSRIRLGLVKLREELADEGLQAA